MGLVGRKPERKLSIMLKSNETKPTYNCTGSPSIKHSEVVPHPVINPVQEDLTLVNPCVANGGWVLKDLGTDPNNPNPGRWDTPISLPYPQPSHEPRPPPQTPNQAPVTLNSTFNGETVEEKPLPPRIGRGGRGKTRKHTNATTPNAEPSQSHEAMRRRTSNTQRSR